MFVVCVGVGVWHVWYVCMWGVKEYVCVHVWGVCVCGIHGGMVDVCVVCGVCFLGMCACKCVHGGNVLWVWCVICVEVHVVCVCCVCGSA